MFYIVETAYKVIKMNITKISFNGYFQILKKYFREGRLPNVKYGIYGGELTADNITIEHLNPLGCGGKTTLGNIALATYENNHKRGHKPLHQVLTMDMVDKYLAQFENVEFPGFSGDAYITALRANVNDCLKNQKIIS